MILIPQIFDITANENGRYKRNELECWFIMTIGLSKHFANMQSRQFPFIKYTFWNTKKGTALVKLW